MRIALFSMMFAASATFGMATGARAGGSLPLSEVQALLAPHKDVTAAIDGLVAANPGGADGVVCTGVRLGNQWQFLGGARIPPFECRIGAKSIEIDAKVRFFDAKGKEVGAAAGPDQSITDKTFKKAKSFRIEAPTWKIGPAD